MLRFNAPSLISCSAGVVTCIGRFCSAAIGGLSDRLERALRDNDCVALGGRIERCTRNLHPLVAHEWDLIVTRWFMLGRGGVLAHTLHRLTHRRGR